MKTGKKEPFVLCRLISFKREEISAGLRSENINLVFRILENPLHKL